MKKYARQQASVQRDVLRLRETWGEMLCLYAPGSPTRRSYRAVLEVTPINLSLKAQDEQEAIIERFGALIKSLSFLLQILVRNGRQDLTPYIQHLLAHPDGEGPHPMPEDTLEKRQAGRKLTSKMLAEIRASLVDSDWRLLHWLLRYPLQRADDLVIGVARWTSRATVYRHLQGLEAKRLVESVLPKTPGAGKRLFSLRNAGLHLLARHLERPARELARGFQADEAGLMCLLPRLPTLLLLQEVVNGLVTHAAQAMTSQGRKPRLVRWTWQREVTHRFVYREQAMRLFAEGAVALCMRTQQADGSPLDQWYGLFILFTELHDERLMRLRLQRLLCWRESPERWSSYQHMLPLLILARSPRQCEHWQQAVETTALRLRLDPLAGALACLPSSENAHMNPWGAQLAYPLERCALSPASPAEATAAHGVPALLSARGR